MTPKHTKGPWMVGDGEYADHVFGPDGFEVASAPQASAIHRDYLTGRMENDGHWATTPGAHRDVRDGEGEANARLIAAAPDLLEALDKLVKNHGGYIEKLPGATGVTDLERARAALSLATGGGK